MSKIELYKQEIEMLKHDNHVWRTKALDCEQKKQAFIEWLKSKPTMDEARCREDEGYIECINEVLTKAKEML